jgi:uncharacterized protein (DUF1800 family)
MNPADPDLRSALARSRFGLGARRDEARAAGSDAVDLLRQEIRAGAEPLPGSLGLLPSDEILRQFYAFREERKAERESTPRQDKSDAAAPDMQSRDVGGMDMANGGNSGTGADRRRRDSTDASGPPLPRRIFLAEVEARLTQSYRVASLGFAERMVLFWSNHFAVSAAKGPTVRVIAGAFEREAIRPHVFGRFSDLLLAVETHPAMLLFLDNQRSVGAGSRAGNGGKRGLNENLAREILELHTLGVGSGYTQGDVTALAEIITGWTLVGQQGRLGTPGEFVFNPRAHEPGPRTLLGVRYPAGGMEQGKAALLALARHPATARHLALKLARHFVADDPPPALVEALAAAFVKSDGDLAAVSETLVTHELAWDPKQAKMRSPLEFSIALLRATDVSPKPPRFAGALASMGQPLWAPPGPNGYSDLAPAWTSAEGISARMDVASLIAGQAGKDDPRALADTLFGPLLSAQTREAVARAETRQQGLALLFLSPEFQRR